MSGRCGRAACRLKEKGRIFRESFLAKLALLLRGTVAAPPERYGETLADEHIRGGNSRAGPAPTMGRCLSISSWQLPATAACQPSAIAD